jgi:hypothetical protein
MFKQKNALIAVAVAMLLAACGGGGGSNNSNPTGAGTGGVSTPGTTTPTTNQPVADADLAGQITLNQVVANDGPVPLEDFEGKTAGTFGLYGQAQGASGSPLKNFGIKFLPEQAPETGAATGNGHIAIEMMDVAANAPQQFQVAIDRVDYKLSKTAPKFEATVPATAKAYVHVASSTGGVADLVLDNLPADVVSVANNYSDDAEFRGLVVDLDKLLAAAKTKAAGDSAKIAALDSVKDFKGEFKLNASYSALNIIRAGQTAQYPGAEILVAGSNQPAIKGAGVQGKIWLGGVDPTAPK